MYEWSILLEAVVFRVQSQHFFSQAKTPSKLNIVNKIEEKQSG